MKNEYSRKDITEEISLIKTFSNDSESVNEADRSYLLFFKEQILENLYELSEALGSSPTIQFPSFIPCREFILTGTNNSSFSKERLAKFQALERKRRQNYLREKKKYEAIVRDIYDEVKNYQVIFTEAIQGLQNNVNNQIIFNPIKLQWKLLPPEATTLEHIIDHFEKLSKQRSDIVVDVEKLNRVYNLNPSSIYMGIDDFEGYLIFYFRKKSKAVLECAVYGNAIYVIKKNWRSLCQLSKSELLNNHGSKVVRIIHKGNWFSRLRAAL